MGNSEVNKVKRSTRGAQNGGQSEPSGREEYGTLYAKPLNAKGVQL